jgi:hypothetical protein
MPKFVILGVILLLAAVGLWAFYGRDETKATMHLITAPNSKASEAERIDTEALQRIDNGEDEASVRLDWSKKLENLND